MRAFREGEPNHIETNMLEGWDEPVDEFNDNPRGYNEARPANPPAHP